MNSFDEIISLVIVLLTVTFVLKINTLNNKIIEEILNWFPAILFAYVIPAGFTHLFGWDLSSVYLHSLSRNWIIPIVIFGSSESVNSGFYMRTLAVQESAPLN